MQLQTNASDEEFSNAVNDIQEIAVGLIIEAQEKSPLQTKGCEDKWRYVCIQFINFVQKLTN